MELRTLADQFEELIEENNDKAIKEWLDEQNISEVTDLIADFPKYEVRIINSLSIHRAASTFKLLDFPIQKRIIYQLPPYKIAQLLNELSPDDRTSFLEELPSKAVRELIKLLDPAERKITLSLLGYPEDSVGRLMTPDYIAVYEHWSVKDVLEYIRSHGTNSETTDVIYVIDENGRFIDDIRIREFLFAEPSQKVSELVDGRFIVLHAEDDQSTANECFRMNHRVALPVVDKNMILLGIVTIDDVLWVATEEYSEDIQRIGGSEALDEPYLEMKLFPLIKKRIGWLIVLFLGEMLTASAMGFFEGEIKKAVVLALFIPLIISSGGNSGSQAATLIIQALAVGNVTVRDWWKVVRREILTGLAMGFILGIVGFLRVILWNTFSDVYGEHWLLIGLTVGFTLVGVVLWGTIAGSMLPLLLKKLGADPAVSSAPFIATLVDVTGLVIYFTVAVCILKGTLL